MEQLLEILQELRPDLDFANEEKLIDNSLLDSFDIITLVGELRDAFGVDIGVEELTADNFNSAARIYAMIERLRAEG